MVKKGLRGLFGKSFNFWDILLIIILIAYAVFIFQTSGTNGLIKLVGQGLFYAIVISWVVKYLIKKAKK